MISTHVYSARLLPADLDLGQVSGSLTLDSSAIPHITGTVSFSVTNAAVLDLLDPRDNTRIELTAIRDGGEPRAFDLGIREVAPDRASGTVTVQLASDEALLADLGQLVDDANPRTHEASLRAVCGYVLSKAGAVLEPGGPDADATAYWAVTNVISDPACASAANFTSGGNANSIGRTSDGSTPIPGSGYIVWSSAAAGQSFIQFAGGRPSARVGETWTLQTMMRRGASSAPNGALLVYEVAANGAVLRTIETPAKAISAASWTPFSVTFTVQHPQTVSLVVYVYALATAAGHTYGLTAPMLHKGGEVIPPFSGSAGASPGYTYSWAGAANNSASTRTPVIERVPEALVWRAGVSAMEFLRTLLLAAGLRLVCDERRRWTLRDEEYRAPGAQAWRYGVNIEDAGEKLSRDDESWFDGAVYVYTWTDADGVEQTRTDAFALVSPPSKVRSVELRNTPYPGAGRAKHVVQRAQGKGRTVTITGIPQWNEATDQLLAVLLDGTPIQTGIVASVEYSLDDDTVTISSRTTDTPADAIVLLPSTINSLPGTINTL